jgi:hypothetical protein
VKTNAQAKRTSENPQVDAELSDNACNAANLMNGTKNSIHSCSTVAGILPEGYTVELCSDTCPHYRKLLDPSGNFVKWLSKRPLTRKQLLHLLKKCIVEGCRAGFVDPALAREAVECLQVPEVSVLSTGLHGLVVNCALLRADVSEVAACQ